MPDLPQFAQVLSYLGTVVGGLFVGGYAVKRKISTDSNSDKIDSKTQLLIDSLTQHLNDERKWHASQLEKEREHANHLGTVIDRLSRERNDAVRALGALQGQIKAMSEQITNLKAEIQRQEEANAGLNKMVAELRDEIMSMSRSIHVRGAQ